MKKRFNYKEFLSKTTPNSLRPILEEAAKEAAKEYHTLLISNIRQNKYGFELAASTIRSRIRAGADVTPLIFTGDYIKSIYVKGTVVTVRKGRHRSGLTYAELSFILEHGRRDKGIPAFPVWTRTYEDFLPKAREIFKRHLTKAVTV